jgi:hypothetical protein
MSVYIGVDPADYKAGVLHARRVLRFRVKYAHDLLQYVVECDNGRWRLVPTVRRANDGKPFADADGAIRAQHVCEVLRQLYAETSHTDR